MTEVLGVDVSHHNGTVDWAKVATGGFAFGICKATEGTTFVDPKFARNWTAIRDAGLVRGTYHFARPGRSAAAAQAEHFARTVGEIGAGDLGPVLDLEDAGDLAPAALVGWAQDFLDRLEALTGRVPLFYTGPGFWARTGNTEQFTRYPLWQAQYGPRARTFGGWPGWTFWQYTDRGEVPGVDRPCDVNRYAGTLADLQEMAGAGDVALAPELKTEIDKIHAELADIKKTLADSYAVLERGDTNPEPGDQMPSHYGIIDVIKKLNALEKKIDQRP